MIRSIMVIGYADLETIMHSLKQSSSLDHLKARKFEQLDEFYHQRLLHNFGSNSIQ